MAKARCGRPAPGGHQSEACCRSCGSNCGVDAVRAVVYGIGCSGRALPLSIPIKSPSAAKGGGGGGGGGDGGKLRHFTHGVFMIPPLRTFFMVLCCIRTLAPQTSRIAQGRWTAQSATMAYAFFSKWTSEYFWTKCSEHTHRQDEANKHRYTDADGIGSGGTGAAPPEPVGLTTFPPSRRSCCGFVYLSCGTAALFASLHLVPPVNP